MGVACQIIINKPKEGVFKPGQVVPGVVKYAIDKPTQYRAITLSLLGRGQCSWTEPAANNTSTTYYGTEDYVKVNINILNRAQETHALDIGSYEYPFEFHLPEDLPSSFNNNKCTISYGIRIEFEKANFFSFNKRFNGEVPVYGFVEPAVEGPAIFGLEKYLFKLFSADTPVVNLKAEILKTCLIPGENVQLVLVLTNNTDVVPLIRADLICYTTYIADCGRYIASKDKIKGCSAESPDIPARGVANLTLTIPTKPELYTIRSKIMVREYRVKITIRLPMPHMNAEVEMPCAIGERKGVRNVELAMEAAENMEAGPPAHLSYCEAMSKNQEKE